MSADKEALARRAVACSGFRLIAGVAIEDPECWEPGATARIEDVTPDGLRVKLSGYASGWWTVRPSMLPVLSDHATLGCIEHGMLPDAWGPAVSIRVHRWTVPWSGEVLADVHVFAQDDACTHLFGVVDTPIDKALVLCLEAAAERREP